MVLMLPWAAVTRGSTVITAAGKRGLVTAVGAQLGRFRELAIDSAISIVDASALVPVVFDEESKALAILCSAFPHAEVISREVRL